MKGPAFTRLWGWPILLGVLLAAGLISALVSARPWAWILSWIGLGLPLASSSVIGRCDVC